MFSPYSQTDRLRDPSSPGNTEPMTIGSPVSSPQNKSISNQNFLPPYLFGETSSPVISPSWNSPIPSKRPRSSFQTPSTIINPISQFKEQQLSYQSPSTSSVINSPNPTKSGAPPVEGLLYSTPTLTTSFDTSKLEISQFTDKQVSFMGDASHYSGVLTPSRSFSMNNASFLSPAQIDPFYTQGEALKSSEQLDESWVTIFGFPPASSHYILQQFNQYGNIIEHKSSPNGNWMHVKYQSKLQAKKALSKNGKVYSGNIMIGVKACIEMDVMESFKENSVNETSLMATPDVSQSEISEHSKPSLKNIRPLTQAYQSPSSQVQATVPKSGGIVSKLINFIK
ncbi:nucleoporin NUP35 isoform X1 [Parasteatoda tepidariorum]|uniref:nucleoporin NUP35 isoform X1 n=2 Tax=Parasteatoda tepidariorum TaxID=114398 RepID=UPI001C72833B|nr:nucleoporin NUP35-like isoform X1 [Parasteatoda tepidariorum]